ncbi:MAG: twin-arginine translocase subunit TatB [Acidobacteria bacterium]|nr:MAG: twin-arginine translocase subunit TatB [Acidobacteriota bacterium]
MGTSELLLILVVALIVFGPRKLPQLSRQLGKSLADFRRASEDFKQTWEKEVAREGAIKEAIIGEAMLPEDRSILAENRDRSYAVLEAGESAQAAADSSATLEPSTDRAAVARSSSSTSKSDAPAPQQPTRKRDWL